MGDMWSQIKWIRPADAAVLQLLADHQELRLTPSNIALNIGYERRYIAKRAKELERRGLINAEERDGFPAYEATELGILAANRSISIQDLKHRTALPEDFELTEDKE